MIYKTTIILLTTFIISCDCVRIKRIKRTHYINKNMDIYHIPQYQWDGLSKASKGNQEIELDLGLIDAITEPNQEVETELDVKGDQKIDSDLGLIDVITEPNQEVEAELEVESKPEAKPKREVDSDQDLIAVDLTTESDSTIIDLVPEPDPIVVLDPTFEPNQISKYKEAVYERLMKAHLNKGCSYCANKYKQKEDKEDVIISPKDIQEFLEHLKNK